MKRPKSENIQLRKAVVKGFLLFKRQMWDQSLVREMLNAPH